MLKELYNSVITRLDSLVTSPADPLAEKVKVFNQLGYWNEQWQFEAQNKPLKFPCCFIEFVSVPWEQLGNKVQQGTLQMKLHIGQSSLDENNVNHFDLLEAVHYLMAGFSGTDFGTFTRTATEIDHNHDKLIAHAITFKVRVQDNTAVRPLVSVEGDLFVLEYAV